MVARTNSIRQRLHRRSERAHRANTDARSSCCRPLQPTVAGGIDDVGGARVQGAGNNSLYVSNISLTDNGKNYYGSYFNDDWKVTPKLTVNLGLRWDFFGLVFEHHGAQANFVPGGPPTGGALYSAPGWNQPSNVLLGLPDLLHRLAGPGRHKARDR